MVEALSTLFAVGVNVALGCVVALVAQSCWRAHCGCYDEAEHVLIVYRLRSRTLWASSLAVVTVLMALARGQRVGAVEGVLLLVLSAVGVWWRARLLLDGYAGRRAPEQEQVTRRTA